jgi:hypothetical protein
MIYIHVVIFVQCVFFSCFGGSILVYYRKHGLLVGVE